MCWCHCIVSISNITSKIIFTAYFVNYRSLFSNQSNLALTLSTTTRQQRVLEALPQEQELRVTVFRALGLRDRSAGMADNDDDEEKIAGKDVV